MTLADLDRRHHDATWLIRKHAAFATAKALTIGHEDLDTMIDRIADRYDLSPADRAALRPAPGEGLVDRGGRLVGDLLKPVGVMAGAGEAFQLVRRARQAARLAKAARTVVTHGAGAAIRVARGGRIAARANPVATIALTGYALGTGGWFLWQANAYNQAVYDLLRARIAPVPAAPVAH